MLGAIVSRCVVFFPQYLVARTWVGTRRGAARQQNAQRVLEERSLAHASLSFVASLPLMLMDGPHSTSLCTVFLGVFPKDEPVDSWVEASAKARDEVRLRAPIPIPRYCPAPGLNGPCMAPSAVRALKEQASRRPTRDGGSGGGPRH
jgi:hypothetical protein